MKVLVNVQGMAPATTPSFTVGSSWTIAYLVDCGALENGGSFEVVVNAPKPIVAVSYSGGSTSDSDVAETEAGTFTLSVQSACAWHVQVIEPMSS